MPSLSSSIVNQQVASVRDVEEALSRQSLYGGDLITNLLELAAVSEERLSKVLAESYDLAAAPVGELPAAQDYVRRLVPGDLAQRFALYPLEEHDGALIVAVAEPLPSEAEQDLAFSLGSALVQKVALLVRVREAIARDYGSPLDRRSLRVLARLSGRPDPSPSSLPSRPDPQVSRLPPPTVHPDQSANAPPAAAAQSLAPQVPRAPAIPDLRSLAKPTPQNRPRRLGPYTAASAERDLMEAESRDDVLRAFFDFAAQYFEYAALFAVHGDLAEGKDASGAGASRARILAVGIPLDLPSAMSRARDSASYELTRLTGGGLDGALAKDLERRPGRTVLFLPVQVRGRTVLILYGDHGERDVQLSEIGDVISFAPLVANAFERMILRRRMREKGVQMVPPPHSVRFGKGRQSGPPLPNAAERAATLASLIEDAGARRSAAPRADSAPLGPADRASRPPRFEREDELTPPTPRIYTPAAPTVVQRMISIGPLPRLPSFDSPPPPSSEPGAVSESPAHAERESAEERRDNAPGTPSFTGRERGTKPGVGSAPPERVRGASSVPPPPPAVTVAEERSPASRSGSLPRLQLVAESAPPPEHDAPEIDVSESSVEFYEGEEYEGEEEDEYAPESDDGGVPLAPASRALAYSARPLPPRDLPQDMALPSVIVDTAVDTRELVERLMNGDTSAGDKLVQIGDSAITVLVGIFPGPITSEPRRSSGDGPGRASECGPVLRALARMGTRPVPFVSVRTADGDPSVRAWATRLLGEMPCAESAQAVVRRLTDDEPDVQRAALAAGHMLLQQPEAAEALQAKIAESVSDATRPETNRHTLIEALAELRAPLVVPALIRLLEDGSPDIVRSAHWALGVIARQDFGTKASLWEEWWLANSTHHRIEWLIDALMHENQELRRIAGDELKSLTKEYFGYYDDLPKKERERAQDRYRQWWETKGKARFH
ncbi:MAG: HEAT repeat domain-containing protein [Pseudomonadota bacterium]